MQSILAEILRNGSAAREGILQPDTRYFVTMGNEPAFLAETGMTFRRYRDRLRRLYEEILDGNSRSEVVQEFQGAVSDFLRSRSYDWLAAGGGQTDLPLQLDLVVNPAELSGLPFEVALGKEGKPLFLESPPVVVTRRVRTGFRARTDPWPPKPKILFVWASPGTANATVPFDQHQKALLDALSPWVGQMEGYPGVPDYRGVLRILKEATLEDLRAACAEDRFTHVHVLAHGIVVGADPDPFERRYGLALHGPGGEGMEAVPPEALAEALGPSLESCVVLSLAVCHGGSQDNPVIPEGGIAHALHVAGVPVVLASQWPLSFDGSNRMVRELYRGILSGEDIRSAIHQTRKVLHQAGGQDWASLVGYVSLPEGYSEQLLAVELERSLAALETASRWADELVAAGSTSETALKRVHDQFTDRIGALARTTGRIEAEGRTEWLGESRGLLGSAHKRFAELHYHWSRARGDGQDHQTRSRAALEEALAHYRNGFEASLSDHWLATQSLSLEAVLTGAIADPVLWEIARRAAERATRNPGEYWAWGSLMELLLLQDCAGLDSGTSKAEHALLEFIERVRLAIGAGRATSQALASTRRQILRYVHWWTSGNGFFPEREDLFGPAGELIRVMEENA